MSARTDAPAPTALLTLPLTSSAGVAWTLRPCPAPACAGAAALPAALTGHRDGIAATVPGEVHTDLLAAGIIPDPFDGQNESALAWIGGTGWTYTGRFTWTGNGHARHDLVAEGLDTVAAVTLNGHPVGRTANQHRSHRFDVGGLLREGDNELVVEFEAPVPAAERLSALLGPRPHVNHHPYNAIRKMAANYGWDWGPDLATAGIWKPLAVESWTGARIAAVRPLATVDGGTGLLTAHVLLEHDPDAGPGPLLPDATDAAGRAAAAPVLRVRVTVGGVEQVAEVPAGEREVVVPVRVDDVRLWWPRGYGHQPLYDVAVRLERDGTVTDVRTSRVGFRTVTLDTAPDPDGNPFQLSVNGTAVYARGANWIPGDALITRMTADRYRQGLRDAVEAQLNLLRVWGGGLYESEDFYRGCDELGLLVWQDFPFACAAYAEEEPLRGEVEAEAREAVTRLTAHPSLVIWNGGNESLWGRADWDWEGPLDGRSWGEGYYRDLLPRVVAELAPGTPYIPGSPFSPDPSAHPNDPARGPMHIWDVWNRRDYDAYREYRPRFVSEFGFQGPPAWSTLTSVVHDHPLSPDGPALLVHQKAEDGNLKLERGLGAHLPRWRDMDEWHWATQLNQARAVGFGVEHFRSLFPLNQGVLVWQLNDCWPVVSWAAVDSHGIRKPLWHTLRRVLAERLLTFQPRDGRPVLFAHNDSGTGWRCRVRVTRSGTAWGGQVFADQVIDLAVEPRAIARFELDPQVRDVTDPRSQFLTARVTALGPGDDAAADVDPAFWYFAEDPRLRLSPRRTVTTSWVTYRTGGYHVTISAAGLVKDLTLLPDRIDPGWRVDSGMVTLAAGEVHTFDVDCAGRAPQGFRPEDLTAPAVLRCANDLVT